MKNLISINANLYLQLLCMVPAVCLLGLTGCSSADARSGKGWHAALVGKTDTHPDEDEDQGWYQPPRSPNFSAYLH
jgi:hypothetical protein